MRPAKLDDDGIAAALALLPAWRRLPDRHAIARSFRFDDFSAAFAFMTRVALLAEKIDHHPEWTNVWNRVDVVLQTHDAGGITTLDLDLAAGMERIAGC